MDVDIRKVELAILPSSFFFPNRLDPTGHGQNKSGLVAMRPRPLCLRTYRVPRHLIAFVADNSVRTPGSQFRVHVHHPVFYNNGAMVIDNVQLPVPFAGPSTQCHKSKWGRKSGNPAIHEEFQNSTSCTGSTGPMQRKNSVLSVHSHEGVKDEKANEHLRAVP